METIHWAIGCFPTGWTHNRVRQAHQGDGLGTASLVLDEALKALEAVEAAGVLSLGSGGEQPGLPGCFARGLGVWVAEGGVWGLGLWGCRAPTAGHQGSAFGDPRPGVRGCGT